MRAERRLGEMMAGQKATVGLAAGTRGQLVGRDASGGIPKNPPEKDVPTLAEAGIDKNLAKRARTFGGLSDEEFEEAVKENRARIADERADGGAQSMSRRGNRQKADRR